MDRTAGAYTNLNKLIFEYKFVVRVLPELPDEELRAIFSRLNRNVVALNKQELRHATYWGGFISLMESLAEDQFWPTSGLFTPNDIRRMLDVEYIGELTIAVLHGPQNKKDSLDKWYEVYEEEFEEAKEVRSTFQAVLGELSQILPHISAYRWSKKSDFYSLFVVLASHRSELPFAREQRRRARMRLTKFAEKIDELTADPDLIGKPDERAYVNAVGRAASDIRNRRTRFEVIERLLSSLWEDS
jgi:hypothetical protein